MKKIPSPLALRFVSAAVAQDRDELNCILLAPERSAFIASDGYRLHAVKSNNNIACTVQLNKKSEIFLHGEARDYPDVTKAIDAEDILTSINVNAAFLRPLMKAVDDDQTITFFIRKKKGHTTVLEVATIIDGQNAYALISGMDAHNDNGETAMYNWRPVEKA